MAIFAGRVYDMPVTCHLFMQQVSKYFTGVRDAPDDEY